MKRSMIYKNLLAGLALLLATSAFAAKNPNQGSFEVFEPTTVDGHQLVPGQYRLTWEGTGPDIEAMILSQGKVVATVPAHFTDLNAAPRENSTESRRNDDGTQSLTQLDFAGKKFAVAFGNEADKTGSTSPAGSE